MSMLAPITEALTEGKAEDVVILPTEEQSGGLFSHIIIATAGSSRHAAALAERVVKATKAAGLKKPSMESSEEREWVLIDCGAVVVHVMREEARRYYQLEALWSFETPPQDE